VYITWSITPQQTVLYDDVPVIWMSGDRRVFLASLHVHFGRRPVRVIWPDSFDVKYHDLRYWRGGTERSTISTANETRSTIIYSSRSSPGRGRASEQRTSKHLLVATLSLYCNACGEEEEEKLRLRKTTCCCLRPSREPLDNGQQYSTFDCSL
jgi:hypothetical protein